MSLPLIIPIPVKKMQDSEDGVVIEGNYVWFTSEKIAKLGGTPDFATKFYNAITSYGVEVTYLNSRTHDTGVFLVIVRVKQNSSVDIQKVVRECIHTISIFINQEAT